MVCELAPWVPQPHQRSLIWLNIHLTRWPAIWAHLAVLVCCRGWDPLMRPPWRGPGGLKECQGIRSHSVIGLYSYRIQSYKVLWVLFTGNQERGQETVCLSVCAINKKSNHPHWRTGQRPWTCHCRGKGHWAHWLCVWIPWTCLSHIDKQVYINKYQRANQWNKYSVNERTHNLQ